MKLAEIANVAGNLHKQREWHREQASYFLKLFNQHAAEPKPELHTVGGSLNDIFQDTLDYNPVQKFYQEQAQHHAAEIFKIDVRITEFEAAASKKLM